MNSYWPSDVRVMDLSKLKVNIYWLRDVRAMELSQLKCIFIGQVMYVLWSCLS